MIDELKQEQKVLDTLATGWSQFLDLPEMHPQDKIEFMHAIHVCQNIVLAREAQRRRAKECAEAKL